MIYPLSAARALQGAMLQDEQLFVTSRFQEFKNTLEAFMLNDRRKALLAAAAYSVRQTVGEALLKIDLENSVLDMPITEVNAKLAALEEYFRNLQKDKVDLAYLLKGELERFNQGLQEKMKEFHHKTTSEMQQEIQRFYQQRREENTAKLLPEMKGLISQRVMEEV